MMPGGRAGNERLVDVAACQSSCIDRVKAVDILGRVDGIEHCIAVDMVGQGKLDQDAINRIVMVERDRSGLEVPLREVRRLAQRERMETAFVRHPALRAHINLACRVFADQNNGQSRPTLMMLIEARGDVGHGISDAAGKRLAVDQSCMAHEVQSSLLTSASIRPLVDGSKAAARRGSASAGVICLANCLPNSTPHWSKALIFQRTLSTKTLCS
jgi:hypothetical protein